ncbi:tRNA pseudouridine(38-40) synthase TruA [bacterium]|nr:tRNA pseudouridine(38-40) synthase TruA [bacterium]
MTRNIKLTIAYNGTNFGGWQIQPNKISIQETIQDGLKKILKIDSIIVNASGRTDAGVHAEEQVANFIIENNSIPLEAFVKGLNSILPNDISIKSSEEVDLDFHSRKSAKRKWYQYIIYTDIVRSPFIDPFAWHINRPLNIDNMQKAANYLLGFHDFASFAASKNSSKTTTRTIFKAQFSTLENRVFFDIEGNGFLMKMVRNIIGTLVEVGLNRKSPEDIKSILESRNRSYAGATAPPQGLFLKKVYY